MGNSKSHSKGCVPPIPRRSSSGQSVWSSDLIEHLNLATEAEREAAVQRHVAAGKDINISDMSGRTLLIVAARSGASKLVRTLIDHGAAVNRRDQQGRNALHSAVFANSAAVIQELTCKGVCTHSGEKPKSNKYTAPCDCPPDHVKLNTKDGVGRTPLGWAVHRHCRATMHALVDADPSLDSVKREEVKMKLSKEMECTEQEAHTHLRDRDYRHPNFWK